MKILSFWKPILVAAVIFYGSLTSNDNLNTISFLNFKNSDKLIHFSFYLLLSLTLISSFYKTTLKNKNILTLILVISYGVLLEFLQYYLTNTRTGDYLDALSNSVGCIFGIYIFPYMSNYKISKLL